MEKYLDKLDAQLNKENEKRNRLYKLIRTGSKVFTVALLVMVGLFVFETGKSLDILDEKENVLQEYANTPEYVKFYNEEVKSIVEKLQSGEITGENFAKQIEHLNDDDTIFEVAKSNKNFDIIEKVAVLDKDFEDSVNGVGFSLNGLGTLFATYGGLLGYSFVRNKISSKTLDRIRKEGKIVKNQMNKKSIVLDIDKDKVTSMHAFAYFELEKMEKEKERENEDEKEM